MILRKRDSASQLIQNETKIEPNPKFTISKKITGIIDRLEHPTKEKHTLLIVFDLEYVKFESQKLDLINRSKFFMCDSTKILEVKVSQTPFTIFEINILRKKINEVYFSSTIKNSNVRVFGIKSGQGTLHFDEQKKLLINTFWTSLDRAILSMITSSINSSTSPTMKALRLFITA